MLRNVVGPSPVVEMHRSSRRRIGKERRQIGVILVIALLVGAGATPALAATTVPALWTAGQASTQVPAGTAATGAAQNLSQASTGGMQVSDLGLLPGGYYASARAINNVGQVTGTAYDASGATQQVIWTGGTMITAPSGYWTNGFPEAINDSRQVVGHQNLGRGLSNGILWDVSGQVFELPPVPGGIVDLVKAHDINASGSIVGRSRDASLGTHAVLWQGTALIRDLGFMGSGNDSEAYGINDLGDIVGVANSVNMGQTRGFLWRSGSFTDLGSLSGPSGASTAVDINNSGLIAGTSNGGIAVVWRNGVIETLPALAGGTTYNFVTDLNSNGDVVGYGQSPSGVHLDTPILWRGGTAIDLGRWPGGTFSRAYGMNDNGQIVGEGNLVDGGPVHALLWTVGTPPPAVSLQSLTLNPTQVSGGSLSTGSVALSAAAPSGGLVVGLSSSNPSVAGVPASVTVAQGVTSASFSVATTSVGVSTTVTISATYGGLTKTATLTVKPPVTADTLAITLAQYRPARRQLSVQATSTSATATLTAYVTATGQRIGTLANNGGGKYSGQFSWPSKPQNITVRSSLGGSATKAVTTK